MKKRKGFISIPIAMLLSTLLCAEMPRKEIVPQYHNPIYSQVYHKFKEYHNEQITKVILESEPIQDILEQEPYQRIQVTNDELNLMVRVVMSESGSEPMECKIAVAETIINRVLSENFANDTFSVVHSKNAYSTSNNGEPTLDCVEAVEIALSGVQYNEHMVYFRTGYYHEFATDFIKLGRTYFSLEN